MNYIEIGQNRTKSDWGKTGVKLGQLLTPPISLKNQKKSKIEVYV